MSRGVRPNPFDEEDVTDEVLRGWQADQLLGSVMENWVTRDVPHGHCRFCNESVGDDAVTEGRQQFCDTDCKEQFQTVFSARLALGRRDLDQRGYD